MHWPGQFWLCLLLPQLLVGCVTISSQRPQPGPAPACPASGVLASLEPGA